MRPIILFIIRVLDSKSKVDLERLPPPKVCLIPHVQRANYRVACYKRADEAIIESSGLVQRVEIKAFLTLFQLGTNIILK